MFARVIKAKAKNYVAIVRGFRDQDGKVKQRVVHNLGPVTEETKEATLLVARRIIENQKGTEFISSADDFKEVSRKNWGAIEIVNALWNKFDLDHFAMSAKTRNALILMLANLFLQPKSKLAMWNNRSYFDGSSDIELHDLYRSLNYLHDNNKDIKSHILQQQKAFGASFDVLFFDVTTLYFESQKDDDLRDFGFSKDCKFNEVQLVLSLVVDINGRPITYEIFPGNTYEGSTLLPSLVKLKKSITINKVVIVADRGMCSKTNLEGLKEAGFDYIVGSRLRNQSAEIKSKALSEEGYSDLLKNEENWIKYKILDIPQKDKNNKITMPQEFDHSLCLWSKARAIKDFKDRERLVVKAMEMVESGKASDKRGAKKYISKVNEKQKDNYLLDYQKIENDAMFDGYYSIAFSSEEMLDAKSIVSAYHNLWRIEDAFRDIKSFFEVRPLFHWNKERILGHIALNFLALVMHNNLELTLRTRNISLSNNNIRSAISNLEYSNLQIGRSMAKSYAPINDIQTSILSALGVKRPKNELIKST